MSLTDRGEATKPAVSISVAPAAIKNVRFIAMLKSSDSWPVYRLKRCPPL